jgi:DNA processing protein
LKIIKIEDSNYPNLLRETISPPKILYVEGNVKNLSKPGIAVVGARKCTDYGKRMCKIFTEKLVQYNLTIISGMAVGIDSIAHTTAIQNLATTIAVLPSGLNNVYPKKNLELYEKILSSGGTIITEYEPEEAGAEEKFRRRNRIVSGLAMGTLVIEGGYRSGSLITARITKKIGRPVFCIPNSLESKNSYATNNLIKNGAYLVTKEEDIFSKFEDIKFEKRKLSKEEEEKIKNNNKEENAKYEKSKMKNNSTNSKESKNFKINRLPEISPDLIEIYNVLEFEPIEINKICSITNKPISEVNSKLTMLEIDGYIKELPGRRFLKL